MIIVFALFLLTLLVLTAVAIVRTENLFVAVMLMAIFSLLMAANFFILDAADVALTEAAVGAGVTTVIFLGALALILLGFARRWATGGSADPVGDHDLGRSGERGAAIWRRARPTTVGPTSSAPACAAGSCAARPVPATSSWRRVDPRRRSRCATRPSMPTAGSSRHTPR